MGVTIFSKSILCISLLNLNISLKGMRGGQDPLAGRSALERGPRAARSLLALARLRAAELPLDTLH